MRFEPEKISYQDLLKVFFKSHNSIYRVKDQYKSALFPVSEEQAQQIQAALEESRPLMSQTTVELPGQKFWAAEWYHQHHNQKQKLQIALLIVYTFLDIAAPSLVQDKPEVKPAVFFALFLSFAPQLVESIWGILRNMSRQ